MSNKEVKSEVNPIPEIPILTYSATVARNNTREYLDAAALYCERTFGEIGLVVETGEYPDIEPPDVPSEIEMQNLAVQFTFKAKIKAYILRTDRMAQQRIQVYSTLFGQLSMSSRIRLKQNDKWPEIEKSKCPRLLVAAIRESHLITETGFLLKDIHEIRKTYYALSQEASESLAAYKNRFDHILKQFKTLAPDKIPDDAAQAIDFVTSLDKERYGQMQIDLDNNAALKICEYPEDLQKAYVVVANYKVAATVASGGPVANAFVTMSNESKLEANGDEQVNERGDKKKKRIPKWKKLPEATNTDSDMLRANYEEPADPKKAAYPCKLCNSTSHKMHQCPRLEDCIMEYMAEKAAKKQQVERVGVHLSGDATNYTTGAGYTHLTPDHVVF